MLREYKIFTNGTFIKVNGIITAPLQARDEQGNIVGGERITTPIIQGSTILGTKEFTNPRVHRWTAKLNGVTTRTEHIVVKEMTDHITQLTIERPTCERPERWPRIFGVAYIDWEEVWDWFRQGLATPIDFGPRFKMIHGLLGTANKMGAAGGCRLGCGAAREDHVHVVRCPILRKMWNKLRNDPNYFTTQKLAPKERGRTIYNDNLN